MSKQYYKFMYNRNGKLRSAHGRTNWVISKEYSVKGKIVKCENGFHASEQPYDALQYVKGDVLALVEVSGDCDNDKDKVCYRTMKIVKAYKWTKLDSVALAIYCAEQVLKIYEDKYPKDSRPRDAIKAAKAYLKDPNKKNAAYASYAASAASAASNAASNAATAAASYATSATAAASYAASAASNASYAAYAATYATYATSAASAASYAAYAASATASAEIKQKINRKMKAQIKKLHEVKL